jgi:hypothetical protein
MGAIGYLLLIPVFAFLLFILWPLISFVVVMGGIGYGIYLLFKKIFGG